MNKLTEFFQDTEGGLSAMRLGFILWIVVVVIGYIVVAWNEKKLPDIPSGVITMTGLLTAGKVVQRGIENNPVPTPPTPTAP